MRVGFTGTRHGMSPAQKRQLRDVLYALASLTEFHHGCAPGADSEAEAWLVASGCASRVRRHPAQPGGELARNREIVAACDLLVAAPRTDREELRSGTWATVRYARHAGKPVVMLSRGDGDKKEAGP